VGAGVGAGVGVACGAGPGVGDGTSPGRGVGAGLRLLTIASGKRGRASDPAPPTATFESVGTTSSRSLSPSGRRVAHAATGVVGFRRAPDRTERCTGNFTASPSGSRTSARTGTVVHRGTRLAPTTSTRTTTGGLFAELAAKETRLRFTVGLLQPAPEVRCEPGVIVLGAVGP